MTGSSVSSVAASSGVPASEAADEVACSLPSGLARGASYRGLARSSVLRGSSGGGMALSRQALPAGGGVASSTYGRSNLGGQGPAVLAGDSPELQVEEVVLANRRLQDDRGALLEEVNIDKVLGFGSMGMVYHGRLYDTRVVVKLIEHGTGVLGKEKERGRLARVEACVSRLLHHPNIVTTYDACTGRLQPGHLASKLGRGGARGGRGGAAGGRQRFMTVMVQELCELGTLRDALTRRKHGLAGPSLEVLPLLYRVALDIANGMKHLASLRVIHADLKAENVLLSRAEATPDRPCGFVAKVADFGLALVLEAGEAEVRQGIHGTVSHMPPEAMKETVFSLATDVFSFGVVLWELWTGESPYRGMAPHEVVEAVCKAGQRPEWPSGSPPELVALAADCWQTDPHQRPTFSDVVERLRRRLAPAHAAPERCSSCLSGMTEESDELELALRQQRRGTPPPLVPHRPPLLGRAGPNTAPSETGSEPVAPAAAVAAAAAMANASSRGGLTEAGGTVGGVPYAAPRDPLGLLLWVLCQYPAEPLQRVPGPGPAGDSEQWVHKVEDMVLASRAGEQDEDAELAAELAALADGVRERAPSTFRGSDLGPP